MGTAARRRAQNAGVLLAMVLVAFAGAMLFSAGSDHHRFDTATAGPAVPPDAGAEHLSLDEPGNHHHQHGTEWTPTASSRVRILAPAVTTVQPRHELAAPSPVGDNPVASSPLSNAGELAQPGVLRI